MVLGFTNLLWDASYTGESRQMLKKKKKIVFYLTSFNCKSFQLSFCLRLLQVHFKLSRMLFNILSVNEKR